MEQVKMLMKLIPVSHLDACDDADGDEPEPEEDVDLLVNDVQGENAEAVKFLGNNLESVITNYNYEITL